MRDCWKTARLDGLLLWPYKKAILLALLLPIAFAAINRSLLTGVSFAMCFAAMTTGYPFFLAEKNRMERLYAMLPVRKSAVVAGRYIGRGRIGNFSGGPAAGVAGPWGKGFRGGRCRRGRCWDAAVCAVYRVPTARVLQIRFPAGADIYVHSRGRLSGNPAFAFAGAHRFPVLCANRGRLSRIVCRAGTCIGGRHVRCIARVLHPGGKKQGVVMGKADR